MLKDCSAVFAAIRNWLTNRGALTLLNSWAMALARHGASETACWSSRPRPAAQETAGRCKLDRKGPAAAQLLPAKPNRPHQQASRRCGSRDSLLRQPHRRSSDSRRRAQDCREHGGESSVPTATSQRRIPVKLLDENRRIINKHLQENDRGKASYTHLIAWAILRALDEFPQLNDGFEVVDGSPSRLQRASVNLGVAIDLTKKDGTRTLLVPNIKNANKLRFSAVSRSLRRRRQARARRQTADRRFSGNDHLADQSGHDRHGRFDAAFDGRTIADHRHRRDRVSG